MKNGGEVQMNSFFYHNFKSYNSGHSLDFLLKKFQKSSVRYSYPPPRSRQNFYVYVNCPRKIMKNGAKIIFLS